MRRGATGRSFRVGMASIALALALAPAGTCAWPHAAHAFRPFDGTDGDTAKPGEFELELGPAHYYAQGGHHYAITPDTVLNLGLVPRLELIVDIKTFVSLDAPAPGDAPVRLLDDDVFLKVVLRRGILQDAAGASMALEGGPLTPELGGERAFGAQADFITSYRVAGVTGHLNLEGAYNRRQNAELFASLILEGDRDAFVRPVSELLVDTELGDMGVTTESVLVGGILTARESLAFDLGLRVGAVDGERMAEVRLGLTWAFGVWGNHGERKSENAPFNAGPRRGCCTPRAF